MAKPASMFGDPCKPAFDRIGEFLADRTTGGINDVVCKPSGDGLFLQVKDEIGDQRYRLHPLSGPEGSADGCNGPVQASDLESFVFDPAAEVEHDQKLYDGLLYLGDLVVWLGREKHRKSNLILQFTICAALGRDF